MLKLPSIERAGSNLASAKAEHEETKQQLESIKMRLKLGTIHDDNMHDDPYFSSPQEGSADCRKGATKEPAPDMIMQEWVSWREDNLNDVKSMRLTVLNKGNPATQAQGTPLGSASPGVQTPGR
eukprot:7670460-Prorocentrum_lima.AAC.1